MLFLLQSCSLPISDCAISCPSYSLISLCAAPCHCLFLITSSFHPLFHLISLPFSLLVTLDPSSSIYSSLFLSPSPSHSSHHFLSLFLYLSNFSLPYPISFSMSHISILYFNLIYFMDSRIPDVSFLSLLHLLIHHLMNQIHEVIENTWTHVKNLPN